MAARGSGRPAATATQVPRAFGLAQKLQRPAHAFSQQTPSVQNPDWHWSLRVQPWPFPNLPQLPFTQLAGEVHCVLIVQVVRQAPRSHEDGWQSIGAPFKHLPTPSQAPAGTSKRAPEQDAALHGAPAAYLSQPPRPLHRPLWPQVSCGSLRH